MSVSAYSILVFALALFSGVRADILSYSYAPRSARGLDANALNEGVFYRHEDPPQSPNCTFIMPLANSPTTGSVTYAFKTVAGQRLQNVIASQRAALFGAGSVIGEYSTDSGQTFQRFFEAINSSAESRTTLRSLNATHLQIRYRLIAPSSWNHQVQLARDCDDTPFALAFDFDVPVDVVMLPRTLTVNGATGGITSTTPGGSSFPRGATVAITAHPDPGFVFAGWFGDVVAYNNPLTLVMDEVKSVTPIFVSVADVNHCIQTPSDIASWWTGDGTALNSITGKSGSLQNGASFTRGYSSFGFSFEGFDESVQLGETSIPVPWTATMWVVRRNAQGGSAALIADRTSALKAEQFGTARKVGFTRYGVADWSFNYSLPTNTWTHLAFVAADGTTRLYVNGALEDSLSGTVPLPRDRLGGDFTDPPGMFKGMLDEIAVFKRALSTVEIDRIYRAGKSAMCKPAEFRGVTLERDGTVSLRVFGPPGKPVTLAQSADLTSWSVLTTKQNPEGLLGFSVQSESLKMFFRLQTE